MKTHKLFLALIGTLIVGTGSAQTWTLDGVSQSSQLSISSTESAVAIDPVSGAVALKTGNITIPTVSISASSPVTVGQNISVTWSTQGFTGGVSCNASASTSVAGWNGAVSSSPVQVTAPSTAQTLMLTLQCTGGNGNATNSTNVTVNPSTGGCPQPGYLRDEVATFMPYQLRLGTFSSTDAFRNPFPAIGAFAGGTTSTVSAGEVVAWEFVAPAPPGSDGAFVITTLASGPGTPISSISTCPGVIDYRLRTGPGNFNTGCMQVGNESGPSWTINGAFQNSPSRCHLTPGTRYYFNFAFETCVTGECIYRIGSNSANSRPADGEEIVDGEGQ